MCKLDDKDYWQVGDEVYDLSYRLKGVLVSINITDEYPIVIREANLEEERIDTFTKEGRRFRHEAYRDLFHIGAITFDEQDRPIAIDYEYIPKREPKVIVTKLPHEFEKSEKVLIRHCKGIGYGNYLTCWIKDSFDSIVDHKYYRTKCYKSVSHCIPYKGNEHLKNEITNCESGKIPEDYVFPEQEYEFKPFDKVLVRNFSDKVWSPDIFRYIDNNFDFKYYCIGSSYKKCIPFECNEHLLGTTDNPEE